MTNDNCPNPCIACPPAPAGAAGLGLSPLDPNYPFVNLSAEAPDIDLFIGRRGPDLGLPPLGSTWYAVGCLGFCFSEESQSEADLCAALQAAACVATQWPVLIPNTEVGPEEPEFLPQTRALYYNSPQMAMFTCPDGTIFTYTVAAGTFAAVNQPTADAWAQSFATIKAAQNYICIPNLTTTEMCVNSVFSETILLSAANKPVSAAITAGALPTGISLAQGPNPAVPTVIFSGSPTEIGSFMFTMTITDALGNTSMKSYSLSVVGITTSSPLPTGEVDTPYSQTLVVGGTSSPVTFSITAGFLPLGLTLNTSTGEISGTPTTEAGYSFTIQADDGTVSCSKDFAVTIDPAPVMCPDWDLLTWGAPTQFTSGSGSLTASLVGGEVHITAAVPGFVAGPINQRAYFINSNNLVHDVGPNPIMCCINIQIPTVSSITDYLANWSVTIYHNGNPLLTLDSVDVLVPTVFNFAVPAGVGSFSLFVGVNCISQMAGDAPRTCDLKFSMSDC